VPATASQCEFCSAELLVKACPRCFARIFHGHEHCSACGCNVDVPASAAPNGEALPRRCPRCQAAPQLLAHLVGEVLLDECPACHGVWLDRTTVERIINDRKAQSFEGLFGWKPTATGEMAVAPLPKTTSGRVYLQCPDCQTAMNRVNFGRTSGIIVDVCRGHGTWFDDKELPAVVHFVAHGGLEKAQAREAEQLRERQRRSRQMPVVAHGVGASLGDERVALFETLVNGIMSLLVH
jgi:Zn-finger nucleic acid-binding protein